jgi:purine-binding chemotaxis protein CheW
MESKGKVDGGVIQLVVACITGEEYGIPIMQVQEIIKYPEVTHIPNMPDFVDGVINLRGKIVPIIDLHKRFALGIRAKTEDTRIVVSSLSGQAVGLVVDAVSEVIRVAKDSIEPIPPAISRVGTEYLDGVCKTDNRLVILLNLEMILTDLEKNSIAQLSLEKKPAEMKPAAMEDLAKNLSEKLAKQPEVKKTRS